MRMNLRNIAIVVIILTFIFVYNIHTNWKQKKELAAYSHETEVYEKHIDELTAKLNECTERKQEWNIKFENEKKRAAELQTALNAARSLASKSQADSSDRARQATDRLTDLESQVKQLTDLRVGLERENVDLRKQQQDRLTNESDALALLHKQLDRALANEKLLQQRLDAFTLSATASLPLPTGHRVDSAVTNSTVNPTSSANALNSTSTGSATLSSSSGLSTLSVATVNATKSAARETPAAGQGSSTMVLRPPLAANALNRPAVKEPQQQQQENAAAAPAPADDAALI